MLAVVTHSDLKRPRESVDEHHAVRQTGQRVVERVVRELLLVRFLSVISAMEPAIRCAFPLSSCIGSEIGRYDVSD